MEASKKFEDLTAIVKILRNECPWDRKQTHESIKDNLIEEAYEAIEAIDHNNFNELKKELGDVLLHVVFHSRMAEQEEHFSIDDVILAIQEKLIRRHPHVFGDVQAESEEDVAENWERIKLEEGKNSVLDGIPKKLPALIRARRMQEKAAGVGFDWPEWEPVWNKLNEELQEFKTTLKKSDKEASRNEFGDLLFSLVNIGRFFDLNAEDCLRLTNQKFQDRFQYVEDAFSKNGSSITDASLQEMDIHWERAKSLED